MAVIAPHPSGWYPDPGGRHQYRFWSGTAWTDHVCDNGLIRSEALAGNAPAVPTVATPGGKPAKVRPFRWHEPVVYLAFLLLWFAVLFTVGTTVGNAALDNKVAATQEQADQYNADATRTAQAAAVVVALVAMAFIAPRVGYRVRDTFMLLIPIWGLVIVLKLLWRLACLPRRYWAPAPGLR
jgi:hypothetical protein